MKDLLPTSFMELALGTSVLGLVVLAFYLTVNGFMYERWELSTKLEACQQITDTQRKELCISYIIQQK